MKICELDDMCDNHSVSIKRYVGRFESKHDHFSGIHSIFVDKYWPYHAVFSDPETLPESLQDQCYQIFVQLKENPAMLFQRPRRIGTTFSRFNFYKLPRSLPQSTWEWVVVQQRLNMSRFTYHRVVKCRFGKIPLRWGMLQFFLSRPLHQ